MQVAIVTVGCPKNVADSDVLSSHLAAAGLRIAEDPNAADVIIVNTCGFIAAATEESIDLILDLAELRRGGSCKKLLVCGCMVQRHRDQLVAELPEVDDFFGLAESCADEIVAALAPAARSARSRGGVRSRLRPPTGYAYVKISDGCDRACTFCTIPSIRGAYRSRPSQKIEAEVDALVRQGVGEVILVGQDTAAWGRDLPGSEGVQRLLARLARRHDVWFRLMYLQPEGVTEELIRTVASHDNVCNYFDIPFQHAARGILCRMGRLGDGAAFLALIERVRDAIPDAALRTSLIVGFPAETERDFGELAEFVRLARLDYAGVFAYSREEGTPAASLGDHIDPDVVGERARMLGDLADDIGAERAAARVGREVDVRLEPSVLQQEYPCEGRSQFQAPEVDGVCLVRGETPSDGVLRVRVIETDGYDMICEPA